MLKIGEFAPEFTLSSTSGELTSLKNFRGKTVILYFYPKDNTPGCTKQACNIRDHWSEFQKKGWIVLGISADTVNSHQKFSEKFSLPFPLLSDIDRTVMKAYGAFGKKKFMGKEVEGTLRYTFVIDIDGRVLHIDTSVKVDNHSQDLFSIVTR